MLAAVQVTGVPMLKGREREARVFLSLSAEGVIGRGRRASVLLASTGLACPPVRAGTDFHAGNLEIGSLPLLSKSSLS